MKKHLSVLALCATLAACAATGNPYTASALKSPPKGQSQVIVYWPEWMNGFPVSINIGDKKCNVLPNSYVVVNVNSGSADVGQDDSHTKISTKAGQRYFIKMSQNKAKSMMGGAGGLVGLFAYNAASHGDSNSGDYRFEVMNPEYAQDEISKTKQLECK